MNPAETQLKAHWDTVRDVHADAQRKAKATDIVVLVLDLTDLTAEAVASYVKAPIAWVFEGRVRTVAIMREAAAHALGLPDHEAEGRGAFRVIAQQIRERRDGLTVVSITDQQFFFVSNNPEDDP